MRKSLKTTVLLVTLAVTAPGVTQTANAEEFKFDSHTSINGVTPGYSEPGSSDLASFSHPDSDLTLDWTNEGKEGGLSRTSGVSAIYNTPEITAKNITVIATQKGNQWNDKGIVYNGTGHNGKITAAGTITVRTNDDCIYTESNGHHIEISGFRKMVLESTGTPSFFQGSSGYVIMNNGTNNFLTITGGENSEIEMTNKGGRAVVADNSSSAGSTKTTITAHTIHLHANGYSAIVQTQAHRAFTGGQIEINGLDKTIITHESETGTAVRAQATTGKGLIEINKKSQGVVEITGGVMARNGTADIDFAGSRSFLKGNMTASGEKGKILADFKGRESRMTGNMASSDTSAIQAVFSGEKASLTGNIDTTARSYQSGSGYVGNRSAVNALFSGTDTSMTGDITAAGDSKVTAVFSGSNASFTGNIDTTDTTRTGNGGHTVDSPNNSTVTAAFSGEGAAFTGNLSAAGTSKVSVSVTSQGLWEGKAHTEEEAATSVTLSNGSRWNITDNSNVSAMDLSSGAIASLSGRARSLDMGTLTASGAPGTFEMDLAYHDNNVSTYETAMDSDFLYVHGGSGSTFTVRPTAIASVDAMKAGDKLYFAQVKDGAAAFTAKEEILLQNKDSLFDNTLSVNKENDATKTDYEDWFITPAGDGRAPNPNAFTPGSAHHAAVAMWRDTDTLLKRLSELRYNQEDQGIWARVINKKLERHGTNGFESNKKTIQVGFDKKKEAKGHDWYYGGAVEHTWGSSDYDEYGTGEQRLTDLTLYVTKSGNDGHYLDLVTKVGYLSSDYGTAYGDSGEFDNWAFSTGAEYGRKKALGKGWFAEPQAQLTYYFLKGDDYTTKNGATIHQDNTDNLVGRLGMVLSKEYGTDTKNPKRFYMAASVQHDFLGDRSEWLYQDENSFHDGNDSGDTWYTIGIGTNIRFGDLYAVYFDAEKDFGADLKTKYRLECGVRFEF